MKTYCLEELREKGSGENGEQSLVAVDGKVYDVSESKRWIKGSHMKRHCAGNDLSDDIKAAPHSAEVLDKFPVVGKFEEAPKQQYTGFKGDVDKWLDRHPFFRRHPHPAMVHVPVGVIMAAAVFELIALVFNSPRTEWAGVCCLVLVALSLPPTLFSGYFAWWMNYDCSDSALIGLKRRLAWLSLVLALVAVGLRAFAHNPLKLSDMHTLAYVIVLFVLTGVISTVGFLGGKLTFPYDH
ncbi:cytochrome b5 domain-containing protein [Thermodesulfobacteriota bacterium]